MGNCFSTLNGKKKAKAKDGIAVSLAELNLRISGMVDGNQKVMQELAGQRQLIGQVRTKIGCFWYLREF